MADIVDAFAPQPSPTAPVPAAPGGIVDAFAPQPMAAPAVAPAASNGPLSEIGAGLARGALVDLPQMAGKALQFAGTPGGGLANFGQSLAANATARGQQPWLTLNPSQHGSLVNNLAAGAEQVAPVLAPLGAGLAAAALAPEALAGAIVGGVGIGGGALLGAGAAGQDTLDQANAKGLSPDAAQTASRLNAATSFAANVGLGLVGGKVMGVAGSTLGRLVGQQGRELASQILPQLTGTAPLLQGFGKATLTGAAEIAGINAGSSAVSAAVNNAYGVSDTTPGEAALGSLGPSLGLAAIMTPFGLAGRALSARNAAQRTTILASPDTNQAIRGTLADQYAAALAAPGTPEAQSAARIFRDNAQVAIDNKVALPVTPGALVEGAIQPPAAPVAPEAPVPQLGYTPQTYADVSVQPPAPETPPPQLGLSQPKLDYTPPSDGIVFPDGTVASSQADVDTYINSFPESQQVGVRARLLGFGSVPSEAEVNSEGTISTQPDALALPAPTPVDGIVTPGGAVARDQQQLQEFTARRQALAADFRTQQEAAIQRLPEDQQVAARAKLLGFGSVPSEVLDAPKVGADITADIAQVNEANDFSTKPQSLVPFQKRLDSLGVEDAPTHTDQINILQQALADPTQKMTQPVRDRMDALLTKWKSDAGISDAEGVQDSGSADTGNAQTPTVEPSPAAERVAALTGTPPAAQDALEPNISASVTDQAPSEITAAMGNNIPPAAPDNTPRPVGTDAGPNNLEGTPRTRAADVSNQVDSAIVALNDKARNGTQLTDLEQERLGDLQSLRKTLAGFQDPNDAHPDEYVNSMTDIAKDTAAAPYKQTLRHYKVANPDAADPGLMLDAVTNGSLNKTLDTIAKNSTTPSVAAYAAKLRDLGTDATISYGSGRTDAAGEYIPADNHVNIYRGGETEQTILHEATHAAQQAQISRAEQIGVPANQREAQLKSAYNEAEQIRLAAKARDTDDQYGFSNAHEFFAELNTNPDFQNFLKSEQANGKSLWQRTVDVVKKLFGVQGQQGNFLDRAMALNDTFFNKESPDEAGFPLRAASPMAKLFNKSPADAAKVTDDTYSKMAGLGDKLGPINLTSISRAGFRGLMGMKTVQYIADRARAVPDFVKSGLAQAVDAYQAAHGVRRLAAEHLTHGITKYAQDVQSIVAKAGGGDASRDLSRQMATIGGEASRGGFDYKMNYADNVKAGRTLPPANKEYIDGIYRQYTQLQRTNPDAAKAIVQGELLNKKILTTKAATVAANTLDAATGNSRKLEAQLARMSPTDADYAATQTRVTGAKGEAALAEKYSKSLDFMNKKLQETKNPDAAQHYDGMSAVLDQRLKALFNEARALPEGTTLRTHLGALEDMYRTQSANPYFSLGRDGDYFVKVGFKNMDAETAARLNEATRGSNKVLGNLMGGDDHAFFRVDTPDQAAGLYNKLLQAGGDKIDGDRSSSGKLADRSSEAVSGVPAALRSLIDNLHESAATSGVSTEAAAQMRDTITRQVLSMLPETSSRSALMQRRGIPGYDADFLGNYARRAQGGIQDTANMYTSRAFNDAASGIKAGVEKLNRAGNLDLATRGQMIADEINRRFAGSQQHMDNTAVNTINSLGHTFYLAASPAYLIRTMAQPFHRALPILGSRYGFVNSSRELAGATSTAVKIIANTIKSGYGANGFRGVLDANTQFKNLGLTPEEESFVQEMHDRGVLNLGQSRQLQSMTLGGTQRQQDLTRMAGMTAQYAEMTNRLITGLAAFRLAQKGAKGVTQDGVAKNTDYAIQAVDRAMDNFDPTNTARLIGKQGPLGKATPLFTAFMNYNLQTMQQIARTVHDGMFNQDKSPEGLQRASEARREFAGLMATTSMISGALGLPFVNAFAGVYNTLTNDNNDPKDIRISVQKFLENNLGHTLGTAISHGPLRAAGFDTSTFGLENLLPGSDFLSSRQLLKDRLADQSQALLGPAISGGLNILQAADRVGDGNYVKGIEAALPSGLKPYYKAAELATKGYTDSKGNPIGIKANAWDVGIQALGFNSDKRATQLENSEFQSAREARQSLQRGLIQDRFYKGAANQDPDTTATASDMMRTFNRANPTQPITNVSEPIRQKLQALALAQMSGTGVGTTVRGLPSMVKNLLQAADPDNDQANGF